jgi:sporulation protein YlmC with PRC-barrel domain
MDHPAPWMKYVNARELDEQANLRNLTVVGSDGEKLGTVDGFIVDDASARPYHVVVNAGGWFTHKRFLVPVGHVTLDGSTLTVDLTKDRVKRFPGFDKSEFEKLSADDLNRMNAELATACCADGVTIVVTAWESGEHYRAPGWWKESYYRSPVGNRRG